MENTLKSLLFNNWQRKAVAIVSGLILWLFVNSSITESKTIPNVPIRIINLPADKTIIGLLPNRLLSKRVTLTLSGTRDIIQELEPGDLEVLLDVSLADSDDWVVKITKKNLVSLNPSIDLLHHITQVEHSEFVLKLSPLVTAKIPVRVLPPTGEAPEGYEFLDIWPQKLMQTVSGPAEEIDLLKVDGLELVISLEDITKADLEALKSFHGNSSYDGEVSYLVSEKLKKVQIPFRNHSLEEINDPEAEFLHLDFLRKDLLKVENEIPIRVFYPLKYSDAINAKTHPLAVGNAMREHNGIVLLTIPLFVSDVSSLFLDIVRENLEIDIVATPKSEREQLPWSLEVIDPHELEDMYVAYMRNSTSDGNLIGKRIEPLLRKRFKNYMQRLALYTSLNHPLMIEATLGDTSINVRVVK